MRSELTTTQHTNCLDLGAKANWTDWTGQNVVWQAEARLFFALMENDFDLALACVNAIKSVLVLAPGTEEGIKVVRSASQHKT
jgi:chondroitin AC lyase